MNTAKNAAPAVNNRARKPAQAANVTHHQPANNQGGANRASGQQFTRRYGITSRTLTYRREFLRLGDEDREVLLKLRAWANEHAETIAREFYD